VNREIRTAHIPNTAELAQLRVDSDGLGMTGTDSLIGLVDETVLSRGIKEEEVIHEILKALGGCAATTNVIVQRLRGHTAAIIPPAAPPKKPTSSSGLSSKASASK
jgi:hypothetical protein